MKTNHFILTFLFLLLCSSFKANSQNPPPCNNAGASIANPNGSNQFEVINLCPLTTPAFYSYLWWMGDNGFSFAPSPQYDYQQNWLGKPTHVVSLVTGNYSSGGPPPLSRPIIPQIGTSVPLTSVIPAGNSIYMQNYRKAIVDDTLYLIISYQVNDENASGNIFLDASPHSVILDGMMGMPEYEGFSPNGEVYMGNGHWEYSDLDPDFHHSMLVPIKVLPNEEEELHFNLRFNYESAEGGQDGIDVFPLDIQMVKSHDPNQMTEHSNALNNCDFGGKSINYNVQFENIGQGQTYYVKIVSSLDEKLDLTSINPNNFILPESFNGSLINGTASVKNGNGKDTYYNIDQQNHTLTFEFPGMILLSPQDPYCTDKSQTRDEVSFSIDMLPNFRFGNAVVSQSTIYFDLNDSIVTNKARTSCKEPLLKINGGGFYSPPKTPSNPTKFPWLVIGVIAIIIGLLIGIRKFREPIQNLLAKIKSFIKRENT